jgi:hypothetical protein
MAVRQIAVGQGSVRGLFIRSSALPSVGIPKRSQGFSDEPSSDSPKSGCYFQTIP